MDNVKEITRELAEILVKLYGPKVISNIIDGNMAIEAHKDDYTKRQIRIAVAFFESLEDLCPEAIDIFNGDY